MVTKIYSVGMRTFEIVMTRTAETPSLWTIESVKELSDGDRSVAIPVMSGVTAVAQAAAFARACDCIDKWLMSNRRELP